MKYLKYCFLALFCAVGAWLVAFPPPTDPLPPGRTVITYWEKWAGREGDQIRQIVDDFNNTVGAERGIYVQLVSMSNINQKTLVATAAGVPPDVAGVWDRQIAQYASLDALEPLDEYARAYGISREQYKPVYWDGLVYDGKLWGLISTPWCVGLHYNKRIFQENADRLRAAGLDPDRPPRTIDEFDRYAAALDIIEPNGRIQRAGYLPLEPGWFLPHTPFWFGTSLFDAARQQFNLDDPRVVRAYEWIKSYSVRLGARSMTEFKDGMSGFDSPQNAFMIGKVAMVKQGPWMANFIENLKPSMNRWNVPPEWLERERRFAQIRRGMTRAAVVQLLGPPAESTLADGAERCTWPIGTRNIVVTFADGTVTESTTRFLPAHERWKYLEWAAAPFPSAVEGMEGVTYAGFDALVIPRSARHKKEAFEFIAYVNRQDVMEKLCSLHCKNSPLTSVSREFIENHPNPYIEVFEALSSSPNAWPIPAVPVWMEAEDEMNVVSQRIYLLLQEPKDALAEAQQRLQVKLQTFQARAEQRKSTAAAQ
jgi:ABC-type glycerol-3-phosphate transport system substrate-binding protein